MNFKDYRIGLVVGPVGLNANQVAEIQQRLRKIHSVLGADGFLDVIIPGFQADADSKQLPPSVLNLQYIQGVRSLQVLPKVEGESILAHLPKLLECDEVWCCPGNNQDSTMCRARPAMMYREGQKLGIMARAFKLIPAWIPAQEVTEGKRKRAKKGNWK